MTKIIPLSKGKRAIVDDADFERLAAFKWFYHSRGYAVRNLYSPNKGVMLMHRQILCGPASMDTDHINGDKLDNRRCNLRIATRADNIHNVGRRSSNTSGFKGVDWQKKCSKWRARVFVNGRERHVGYFDSPEDAAVAYNSAASEHYGEFARLNDV